MVHGKVSIIIPSRNEQFLVPTVIDLLAKARGEIEIVVILDGYWELNLPSDKRLKILHRGVAQGMRPAINAAAQIASGAFLLKCDGHTLWDEGYDEKLKADYAEDNWILIPRRQPLDPEGWTIEQRDDHKYPIDYHYLAEPFNAYGDSTAGLHGTGWRERRDARQGIAVDEEMASQGSAWFCSRRCWDWLGPLKPHLYGSFWFENQEMSLTAWMAGGAQMVTKNTWYAHLYKGKRYGRGYSTRNMGHEDALKFTNWFWMTDQPLPQGRVRTMRWLVERFAPVPTWPEDLDGIFARARETFANPYQVAA